jgi:hypothetical protein
MKNIHVIPTEKPSRLFIAENDIEMFILSDKYELGNKLCQNQNIYITSDEVIKEGEYGLSRLGEIIKFHSGYDYRYYAKIILTTDQYLIADGVQSIDDTFLEWFCKNPSCESVEVYYQLHIDEPLYKIFIPQEEPKQETLRRDYSNRNCKTCNLGQEGDCELKLESKCASYANDETLGDYWISCLDDESDSILYKQQTLEEAAERLYPDNGYKDELYCDMGEHNRELFIKGAEWQAKRTFSFNSNFIPSIIEKYLETAFISKEQGYMNPKEWLEQFKKK